MHIIITDCIVQSHMGRARLWADIHEDWVRTLAGTCTASQLDRGVFGLVGDQTIYLHLAGPITSSRGRRTADHTAKVLPVVTGMLIAIIIGLFLPVVAAALYAGLAVYLVIPFREAARVLILRHSS